MSDPHPDDASAHWRTLFEESLAEIERAVSWATRRLCLPRDDAEEFRSWVYEKLIEDDYRILRDFGNRSSLATYLVTVILNLGRDYRTQKWGRWRPSAAAERLGLVAMQLETLLYRDGFSLDEAVESLRSNHAVKLSKVEIVDLAAKLPARTPLAFEGEAKIASAAAGTRTDARVLEQERGETLRRTQEALAESLAVLSVEDRLVLKMHYQSGLTIAAIATALDLDQRTLYTRRDRCLRQLKSVLESRGLESTQIFEALSWFESDFEVNYGVQPAEFGPNAPSNESRAEVEDSP